MKQQTDECDECGRPYSEHNQGENYVSSRAAEECPNSRGRFREKLLVHNPEQFAGRTAENGHIVIDGEEYMLMQKFMGNSTANLYSSPAKVLISWNYLHKVIEKIDTLYTKAFPPDFVDRILAHEDSGIDNHYMEVIATPLSTPITKVVPLVVEFIKWYDSQQGYKGDTHSQEE